MKVKRLLLLVLVLAMGLLAYGATGLKPDIVGYPTVVLTETLSGAQLDTELIAGSYGVSIFIKKMIMAAGTATSAYFSDAAGAADGVTYGKIFIPTSGTVIDNFVFLTLDAGEALYINSAGGLSVQVEYKLLQ